MCVCGGGVGEGHLVLLLKIKLNIKYCFLPDVSELTVSFRSARIQFYGF